MIPVSSIRIALIVTVSFSVVSYCSLRNHKIFEKKEESSEIHLLEMDAATQSSQLVREDHSIKVETESLPVRGCATRTITTYNDIRVHSESSASKTSDISSSSIENTTKTIDIQKSQYSLELFSYLPYKALIPDRMSVSPHFGINASMRVFRGLWASVLVLPQDKAIGAGIRIEF